MLIDQIAIFLENKPGRIARVTQTLKENDINIRALYVADSAEYGILRMIVDNPKKAEESLTNQGFMVNLSQVIAVSIHDVPGGLHNALSALSEWDINIEYSYAYMGRKFKDEAVVVIKVQHNEMAIQCLINKGITLLTTEDVYAM